jgi:hypothetical protein
MALTLYQASIQHAQQIKLVNAVVYQSQCGIVLAKLISYVPSKPLAPFGSCHVVL